MLFGLTPNAELVAEAIKSRGLRGVPSAQVWPVRVDGQNVYLPLEEYDAAVNLLVANGLVRINRVAGIIVWRG